MNSVGLTDSGMRRRCALRRGTALYIAVLSTAMIVSLLGMAGLSLVRVQREGVLSTSSRGRARCNARSAVELALRTIANDSDWRNTYANGVETTPVSFGSDEAGTVSWVLEDSDGDLTDSDTALQVRGFGRHGDSVQVSSALLIAAAEGPMELRSQTDATSVAIDMVRNDKYWCQYLKPTLPADAVGWRVTSVEVYCHRDHNDCVLDVRIYQPLASNWPSATVIDEISINSDDVSHTWGSHEFEFTGQYSIAPTEGVCLALETVDEQSPIRIAYRNSGVIEADSALIHGDPTWNSLATDQALIYRVHGDYITSSTAPQVVAGTWFWDSAP